MKINIYVIEYKDEDIKEDTSIFDYAKQEIKKGIKPFIKVNNFYSNTFDIDNFVDNYGEVFRSIIYDTYVDAEISDRFIVAYAWDKKLTNKENKKLTLRLY